MDQQYVYFVNESTPVNSVFMENQHSGNRLRWCLRGTGRTPSEFAHVMGVSNQTLNNWFGRGVPGRRILQAAKFLDVRPEWLQSGEGSPLNEEQLAEIEKVMSESPEGREARIKASKQRHPISSPSAFNYPEIRWDEVADPVDPLELQSDSSVTWYSSDVWAGHRGYWVKVSGTSMASSNDVSFPEGSLILVDPEATTPKPGQFIVARLKGSREFTFKQLARDAGDLYLTPLNLSFPIKLLDESWEVVGTVVDAKLDPGVFV